MKDGEKLAERSKYQLKQRSPYGDQILIRTAYPDLKANITDIDPIRAKIFVCNI